MNRPAKDQPLWTDEELPGATGGAFEGALRTPVTGISIDSRTLEQGDMFVAIEGLARDGHEFAVDALKKGAALALVSKPSAAMRAAGPLLVVDDSLHALEALGRAARMRTTARVAAITGSVGKTGSRRALMAALAASGTVHGSQASYNNHWGVPLSLARMPQAARYGVFEVGMNHAGEITPLSEMVKPDVALITTVAPVHLGHFSGLDEIAEAKAEIFAGLTPGGAAVVNRDNEYFEFLYDQAKAAGAVDVVGFGEHARAEARLLNFAPEENASEVRADILGERVDFRLNSPGRHHAINALGVLSSLVLLGGDLASGAAALSGVSATPGRGARRIFKSDAGDVTVIDESYNANPASMAAALEVLGNCVPARGGRRIAVLGDMLELGVAAPRLHAGLAAPIAGAGVDLVHACGAEMAHLRDALPAVNRGIYGETSDAIAAAVADDLKAGDIVMVKGSLGSGMAAIVQAIAARFEKTAE